MLSHNLWSSSLLRHITESCCLSRDMEKMFSFSFPSARTPPTISTSCDFPSRKVEIAAEAAVAEVVVAEAAVAEVDVAEAAVAEVDVAEAAVAEVDVTKDDDVEYPCTGAMSSSLTMFKPSNAQGLCVCIVKATDHGYHYQFNEIGFIGKVRMSISYH